ncbi:MAG: class I SAM-dependent DNA methyltransferase, partial [Helicobacter sp.]|nr:class I SAM-dependent DNA methyltransferase [Helicobacter sp.]
MRYCPRILQDFVQSHSPFSPAKDALEEFGQSLESYLAGIADSKGESEEHQKNLLRDFLHKSFNYDCNTKDRIDLAIYEDSVPKVLFEVKKSDNAQEFVKPNAQNPNLECKAFYESILYFLRETITNKNNNLTHIVLTNTKDFYIIDAKVYAAFAKDKAILKAFKNCEHKEGNDASTKRFYEEIKNLLPNLDMEIPYTHFRVEDSILANCHSELSPCHSETLCHSEPALAGEESQRTNNKEHILPLLYQILSPHVLLKRKTYLDANTLNQDFYDELLYILGLKENVQSGKALILPSLAPHTLLDSICSTFELERDKDFEILFSLLTTWNNRLLFLRLLESMLLSFKHIKKPFLNLDCLKDFQALNTLFFDILAKIEENRDTNLPQVLAQIPYLNSSLFEKTALEIEGKEIKLLESKPLILYHDSILYKDKNFCQSLNLNAQAKDSTLPLLEYLFAFLHAYDFTTTAQDIQNHTKMNFDKLINSAVLGLVFEKLNGYKEGSFYTPSFITRYMCKQSLERVVLQKFNESLQWDCQNLDELKNKIDKLTDSKEGYKQANAIFDSIHICDPAVGSGHFLVSALNELILLKFKLGILCDENHHRIKDITLEILRDEIVIRDSQNALFTYTLPAHDNIESHKIQRALFFAKRKLIESCLFGVDINPNSCEITKLRLWIELLKYSYYKDIPNKRLETLPNIDINIKCGNSLISNIALDITKDSLIKELKRTASKNASLEFSAEFQATANDLQNKLPKKIEEYREAVNAYKNETNADFKALQKKTIAECQVFITQLFFKLSNEYKIFKEALANYLRNYGYNGIDEGKIKGQHIEQALQQKLNDYLIAFNFHKTLEIPKNVVEYNEKELIFLITSLQNYEKLIHDQNAFEWRFAFPEVLDSNGDFLGFDLVIGNPPYISTLDLSKSEIQNKDIYKKQYPNIKGLY